MFVAVSVPADQLVSAALVAGWKHCPTDACPATARSFVRLRTGTCTVADETATIWAGSDAGWSAPEASATHLRLAGL